MIYEREEKKVVGMEGGCWITRLPHTEVSRDYWDLEIAGLKEVTCWVLLGLDTDTPVGCECDFLE